MPQKPKTITQDGEPVEPTVTKRQAREVGAGIAKPGGSPDVVPWRLATRRQRASWGPVVDFITGSSSTTTAALDLYADIVDAIATVALVPLEGKRWGEDAKDAELMDFAGWYLQEINEAEGEAMASPIS